jgi:uncharacterized membrane protein
MKRAILLTLGWLLATAGLYVALVMLELYWNLYEWEPRLDLRALGLFCGMVAVLATIRVLARAEGNRFSQGVSLAICLALLALGVYVFPAEPITHGMFAREMPSPLWYRAGRFVLLALPCLFWGLGMLRWRKQPAE